MKTQAQVTQERLLRLLKPLKRIASEEDKGRRFDLLDVSTGRVKSWRGEDHEVTRYRVSDGRVIAQLAVGVDETLAARLADGPYVLADVLRQLTVLTPDAIVPLQGVNVLPMGRILELIDEFEARRRASEDPGEFENPEDVPEELRLQGEQRFWGLYARDFSIGIEYLAAIGAAFLEVAKAANANAKAGAPGCASLRPALTGGSTPVHIFDSQWAESFVPYVRFTAWASPVKLPYPA